MFAMIGGFDASKGLDDLLLLLLLLLFDPSLNEPSRLRNPLVFRLLEDAFEMKLLPLSFP